MGNGGERESRKTETISISSSRVVERATTTAQIKPNTTVGTRQTTLKMVKSNEHYKKMMAEANEARL